jgi:Undecaprenyl-phosphate glucose phosphotransferase
VLRQKSSAVALAILLTDVLVTNLAWLAAYVLRFHSEPLLTLFPPTKGVPGLERYGLLLPLLSVVWPIVLYFHGLYQLKRGRSRIDEFFAILISVLLGSALCMGATLYIRVYYRYQPEVAPLWEFSQVVFAAFIVLDVLGLSFGRWAVRWYLERRRAAGLNVDRVVVAGAGPLGQAVAETLQAHRELGFAVVGFVDDNHQGETLGLPILGTLDQIMEVTAAHRVDQLYIALTAEEHSSMLRLVRGVRNECLDIRVVPDLLQYASMKATLEDLDGIPIISLNDVPLRGWNSMIKRAIDIALATTALTCLTVVPILPLIALLIRWLGGKGPVFYRQERMSVDGRTFSMYKFRSMCEGAETETGPVWASAEDPRRTPIGVWLRRFNLDELPQLINVLLGDMSLVGPRPERPAFVRQFKERIPQYMLRHRVKSGITGWAQVNGWRGNTSIEKRIEFDLYYIENWSLALDLKIMILTLLRGFGQRHAY